MKKHILNTPMNEEEIRSLKIGDVVYITGHIFTARDMALLKIQMLFESGEPLPKDLHGSAIFHAGPVVHQNSDSAWELNVIGPTTSIRMEPYADLVGKLGVLALIGKGGMAEDTLKAASKYGYVYLQAAPGCAAKLAQGIQKINDVTWLDLGMPEAVWDLQASEFGPFIVGMDTHNCSIYQELKQQALKRLDYLYPCT